MNVSFESCLTFTFMLATLSITMIQGQVNSCDINSRPHPQGICGSKLARAHSNLCFLLSQAYPELFSSKRSVHSGIIEKIYSIPLDVLAELDISNGNWNYLLTKKSFPSKALETPKALPRAAIEDSEFDDSQAELSDINRVSRTLIQMLSKSGGRQKRSRAQSSMVCDCCYNQCTPRHLATYC